MFKSLHLSLLCSEIEGILYRNTLWELLSKDGYQMITRRILFTGLRCQPWEQTRFPCPESSPICPTCSRNVGDLTKCCCTRVVCSGSGCLLQSTAMAMIFSGFCRCLNSRPRSPSSPRPGKSAQKFWRRPTASTHSQEVYSNRNGEVRSAVCAASQLLLFIFESRIGYYKISRILIRSNWGLESN